VAKVLQDFTHAASMAGPAQTPANNR